jgi:hypothetical protein
MEAALMVRNSRSPTLCRLALVLSCAAILGATACRRDNTPRTWPVRGKVVYKKLGQPVPAGTALFESVGTPRVQASGEIQPDGTFELASDLGKPGTVAGEHRVLIQPPFAETGQKPLVARRYASYATSGLKTTVNAGSVNEVTLEVER